MTNGRVRRTVGIGVVALALLGACGGGGGSAPATPGANVDPTSNNGITGPINKAKQVGQQSEARDKQMEGAGDK
jgi:hypothetical protein